MMINQMLSKSVYCSEPFDHWIIDDFLDQDVAESMTNEFIDFDDGKDVVHYKGWIGDKKTCNVWNRFPATTYDVFTKLLSSEFTSEISSLTNIEPLFPSHDRSKFSLGCVA